MKVKIAAEIGPEVKLKGLVSIKYYITLNFKQN